MSSADTVPPGTLGSIADAMAKAVTGFEKSIHPRVFNRRCFPLDRPHAFSRAATMQRWCRAPFHLPTRAGYHLYLMIHQN